MSSQRRLLRFISCFIVGFFIIVAISAIATRAIIQTFFFDKSSASVMVERSIPAHPAGPPFTPLPPAFTPSSTPMPLPSLQQTTPAPPSPTPALPSIESSILDKELEKQLEQQKATKRRYEKVIEALPVGQCFHNIPVNIKANVSVIVKVGLASSVTDQLLNQLDIKDDVNIAEDIRYDPLGVEIKLDVDNNKMKSRPITEGRKPIIPGDPAIWIWELTPIKRGKTVITIQALVDLKIPGVEDPYKRAVPVFSEEREIQINPSYTLSQIIANNWKEISGLVVGSGSFAAFYKWLIERQSQKDSSSEKRGITGFGRLLNPRPEKKDK